METFSSGQRSASLLRGKRYGTLLSATVRSSIWCHDDPGHGTKIMRGEKE